MKGWRERGGGAGGGREANGVKSHPKQMEMKKKFLLVQKLHRELLGMLKWDSLKLLSANSLRMIFLVLLLSLLLLFGFSDPTEKCQKDAWKPPNLEQNHLS